MSPCKPHKVQKGQVQGPACGLVQSPVSTEITGLNGLRAALLKELEGTGGCKARHN